LTSKPAYISLGDPSGIGPEVFVKSLHSPEIYENLSSFIVVSSEDVVRKTLKNLNQSYKTNLILNKADISNEAINILNVDGCHDYDLGSPKESNAKYILDCLKKASDLSEKNKSCLITGPINKKVLSSYEKKFSGHTEFLKSRFKSDEVLMFLSNGALHLGIITTHIPLSQVSSSISKELILKKYKLLDDGLKNIFKISKPRIGVLGLNPHAGESGTIGTEEDEVISPAINELIDNGYDAIGPISADTAFAVGNYDAVLSMYHDQALPVIKTLDFNKTVNITLGLPFLRVSVDHGTAENIASDYSANNESMLEAMRISLNRHET
jgi:4-hydroxythreonine-4-phosphate dehydrogenase